MNPEGLSDEELAMKLQEELDVEQATAMTHNNQLEMKDKELARRMQEEADVEAEFERAMEQRRLEEEQAKAAK
eukprot:gene11069-18676_t